MTRVMNHNKQQQCKGGEPQQASIVQVKGQQTITNNNSVR